MIKVNGTREPLEFKSHQWFGATVRTHKGKVVVSDAQKYNPVKEHLQSSSCWMHASVYSWMRLETLVFISKYLAINGFNGISVSFMNAWEPESEFYS